MATTNQKTGTTALLFQSAQKMGLNPTWIRPNGMFAVSFQGQEHYVSFAFSSLNSHATASLARDKYLTRRILERHALQNIPYMRTRNQEDAALFLAQYGTIIAKPTNGSGSRDIHIITSLAQLAELNIAHYILEKYIPGKEFRYLILNDRVLGVHQSDYGASVQQDRELKRISYPMSDWNPQQVTTSLKIASIFGLRFAAIDFMIDDDGTAYILEINSAPGLKWFHAPTSGPVVNVADQLLAATFGSADDSLHTELLGVRLRTPINTAGNVHVKRQITTKKGN